MRAGRELLPWASFGHEQGIDFRTRAFRGAAPDADDEPLDDNTSETDRVLVIGFGPAWVQPPEERLADRRVARVDRSGACAA